MSTPQLRPLGLGDILDGAFTLYRRHFATLFSTALLGFLPVVALIPVFAPLAMMEFPEAEAVFGVVLLLAVPLIVAATVVMWGALTRQYSQAYLGGEVSVRDGYAHAFRRLLPLLGAAFLAWVAVVLGFVFCIVPGILLAIMLFAAVPAVVLEGRGPLDALGRSRELAKGAWGSIALVYLVIYLIAQIPGMGLWGLFVGGMLAAGAADSEVVMVGVTIGYYALSLVVSALTTPFLAGGLVLLYYDRRVRTEALDLELAAQGLSPSA